MFATITQQLDDLLAHTCEGLQLPASLYDEARDHYESVGKFLDRPGTTLAGFSRRHLSSGFVSYRHEYETDLALTSMMSISCASPFRNGRTPTKRRPFSWHSSFSSVGGTWSSAMMGTVHHARSC